MALLHEKPYAGFNGSGKHMNWSIGDDLGHNLLSPGKTPHENLKFMLTLTAIIRAVDMHQDLLRASIASASNDHRLGANEAPPAIISIFVGDQLSGIIDAIIEGRAPEGASKAGMQLGADVLPTLRKDISDRNRTSPFAFTGNKFEFRAVGSNQSVAYPAAFLNTIVAESMEYIATRIEERRRRRRHPGDRQGDPLEAPPHPVRRRQLQRRVGRGDAAAGCSTAAPRRRRSPPSTTRRTSSCSMSSASSRRASSSPAPS